MTTTVAARRARRVDLRRALAAARVIHPFPTALNVAAAVALAAVAVDGVPPAGATLRLAAAMFCVQAAIGASNDYCDRDLDAVTKPYKPIVRGLIEPRAALALAVLFAASAGVLAATLGARSFAVGAVGLAAGLAYNARLKRSPLSALPFMVALPALPFWVWVSLGRFDAVLWWLLPVAPFAGAAVHLSNTLPDLERDTRAGVRGLAHRLGRERSIAIAWGSCAAAIAAALALGLAIDGHAGLLLLGVLPATALLAAAVAAYALRRDEGALQFGFGVIGIATAALAGGWLASVT